MNSKTQYTQVTYHLIEKNLIHISLIVLIVLKEGNAYPIKKDTPDAPIGAHNSQTSPSAQTVYRVYEEYTKRFEFVTTHSIKRVYGVNTMMETVSFKLPLELNKKLKKLAEDTKQPSRHMCAKRIVEDYLMNPPSEDQTVQSLIEIRHSVLLLREDFASAVACLLVKAGKVKDMKEAIAWTRKYMPLED